MGPARPRCAPRPVFARSGARRAVGRRSGTSLAHLDTQSERRTGPGCVLDHHDADRSAGSPALRTGRPRPSSPPRRRRAARRGRPEGRPLMCGIAGIVELAGERRAARRRRAGAHVRRAPPPRAGRVRHSTATSAPASRTPACRSSTCRRGQQPLSQRGRTLWIVFNGEIFNYVELRDGARGARPPLPHRAATPRSSSTPGRSGATTRFAPLQRPVGDRALGRAARSAGAGARSARRAAALPLRARRPAVLRQRGEGDLRRRSGDPARASIPPASTQTFTFWTVGRRRSTVFARRRRARARPRRASTARGRVADDRAY